METDQKMLKHRSQSGAVGRHALSRKSIFLWARRDLKKQFKGKNPPLIQFCRMKDDKLNESQHSQILGHKIVLENTATILVLSVLTLTNVALSSNLA